MEPTPNTITALELNQILVFGSNTQGKHGAGLARVAVQFGAENGNPIGRQGQTYAIVTKDLIMSDRNSIPIKPLFCGGKR